VIALSVRLALVSASYLADVEVKLRTFPGVHKLGTYNGVIRLTRAHQPCAGCPSTSSQYAVVEALLLLRPGDYRRHLPRWCVLGDGVAGKDAE
jgi:hypothetical protein